ncbi:MAG TPA: hypothetical protein VLK33_04505, partial [Terriglobales bacterium]|nr:hypothetical protein [Terriglobales bacterium]
ARRSETHMGRDAFAFTKNWLEERWDDIGDVILGASMFDLYLCALIRHSHGIVTTRKNFSEALFPADIERGFIAHQAHVGQWNHESATSPAEKNNRQIFHDWAKKNLPDLKFTTDLAI